MGERFPTISTFFSLVSSRRFRGASHSLLTSLFKNASVSPFQNLQRVFHLWKSIDFNSAWVDIFNDVNLLFPRLFLRVQLCSTLKLLVSVSQTMLTGLFEDASFGHLLNLHMCLSIWTVLV